MPDPLAARRPRPVAEAPVPALVAAAPELAKRWLIELVASAPLELAAALPVDVFAREAPALCAAVSRALAEDEELDRLSAAGEMAPVSASLGRLAGARDGAEIAAATERLRTVMWSAALAALPDPSVGLVSDLSSRLAHVCAVVCSAALGERFGREGLGRELAPDRPAPPDAAVEPARVAPPERQPPPEPFVEPDIAGPLSLRDERRTGEEPAPEAPWLVALGRRLERQASDGAPFAALVVEVDGIERLLVAETGHGVAAAIEAVERAVCRQLRPADVLVREGLGRYWIVAPDTDRAAASLLGGRLAAEVARSAVHRGAPLTVSIGMAVSPDDGAGAQVLADFAEEELYAARATGHPPEVGGSSASGGWAAGAEEPEPAG